MSQQKKTACDESRRWREREEEAEEAEAEAEEKVEVSYCIWWTGWRREEKSFN